MGDDDLEHVKEQIKKTAVTEAVQHAVEVTGALDHHDHYHNRIIAGLFIVILALVGFGVWNHITEYGNQSCPRGSHLIAEHHDVNTDWLICEIPRR